MISRNFADYFTERWIQVCVKISISYKADQCTELSEFHMFAIWNSRCKEQASQPGVLWSSPRNNGRGSTLEITNDTLDCTSTNDLKYERKREKGKLLVLLVYCTRLGQ